MRRAHSGRVTASRGHAPQSPAGGAHGPEGRGVFRGSLPGACTGEIDA
jgi:hypothetical protein